jgi:hypothetical protein
MYAVLLGAAPVRNTMRLLAIYYPTTRVVANVVGRRRVPMMMREKMTMATTTRQRGAVNDAMHTRVPYLGRRMEEAEEAGRKFCILKEFRRSRRKREYGIGATWNRGTRGRGGHIMARTKTWTSRIST